MNTATDKLGKPIFVNSPAALAVTPNGKTLYVINEGSQTVNLINTANNTIDGSISVGNTPDGIAVTPDGLTAYVSNETDNTVSTIDTATKKVSQVITVGNGPDGIAITPDQAPESSFVVSCCSERPRDWFDASASSARRAPSRRTNGPSETEVATTTTGPRTTHVYKVGSYVVTLTFTDRAGTSLNEVFTGQTASNNGGALARSTQQVEIP